MNRKTSVHSNSTEWQDLEADLDRLLAMDAVMRATALQELAASDPARATALRQWLADIAQSEGLLERLPPRPQALAPGTPWRLLRPIGSGGMGEVWLGERADGAFQRQVAIKFLRADRATLGDKLIRERELLARLRHPGIAMLLDGGVSAHGEPFLVTEWIDGVRLDHWLRDRRPDLRARVEVLCRITGAVAFAHANLIVHRDLKPANVMIDHDGIPHLLDFGIARLLDDSQAAMLTDDRALTPAFAAPEQLTGGAITTRSDIYALGGLLYWLLTGRTPHNSEGLALAELVERVCHQPIQPPSTAPAAGTQDIDADLDAIVLTALARQAEHRYASAELLALDLKRWLNGENVLARLPTRLERLLRFARRHRVEAGLASALLVTLVAGTIGIAWQAAITRQQRDAAIGERDTARIEMLRSESLIDNFAVLLRDSDDEAISANNWLDRAAALAEAPGPADATARARLLAKLGEIEHDRGLPERALARFDRLLGSYRNLLSPAEHANALCYRGSANASAGHLPQAAADIEAGNAIAERLRGADRMALVECLSMRANVVSASAQSARPEDVRTLQRALRELDKLDVHRRESWRRAALLHKLAMVHQQLGDDEAALAQFELVRAIDLQLGTDATSDGISTQASIAAISMQLGQLRRADRIYAEVIAIQEKNGRSVQLTRTLSAYSILKNQLAQSDAAIALSERSAEMRRVVTPDDALGMRLNELQIARALIDKKAFSAALETLHPIAAVYAAARPENDYINLLVAAMRAEALIGLTDIGAARRVLAPAIELAKASGNASSRAACFHAAARLSEAQGDWDTAITHLQNALIAEKENFPSDHWRIAATEVELAQVELSRSDLVRTRALLDHAQPIVEDVLGADHWRTQRARALRDQL
jgi:eukaryotic-like serine/threonine-protein kinase